ncbi:sulfurtransferase complex subunit TusD [Alteromonas sp. ASW11-130]|uniref:sulfurtransferase complex subunit TusD n=1 Tax=Alteromonas sp. ASW11-130 TaxID=3015775 RepID=UPI002241911C|nr:sulfurtransferase complex subunit TusD [Alteromonas sp. ASW11-130]MCW8092387.1 sulfurtransferase complex subunit TusD [Alteromonas sp. ASW11-130]
MHSYSMLITSAPYEGERIYNAQQFAQSLLDNPGTHLVNIFFYQQGVLNANCLGISVSGQRNLYKGWCDIASNSDVSLQVCVTAAARRGIISKQEQEENALPGFTLRSPFEQTGLSDFFAQLHSTDRLVQF